MENIIQNGYRKSKSFSFIVDTWPVCKYVDYFPKSVISFNYHNGGHFSKSGNNIHNIQYYIHSRYKYSMNIIMYGI